MTKRISKGKEEIPHYKPKIDAGKKMKAKKRKNVEYWNEELESEWTAVCKKEKSWKMCKAKNETPVLRAIFNDARTDFDKSLRKARYAHQNMHFIKE